MAEGITPSDALSVGYQGQKNTKRKQIQLKIAIGNPNVSIRNMHRDVYDGNIAVPDSKIDIRDSKIAIADRKFAIHNSNFSMPTHQLFYLRQELFCHPHQTFYLQQKVRAWQWQIAILLYQKRCIACNFFLFPSKPSFYTWHFPIGGRKVQFFGNANAFADIVNEKRIPQRSTLFH
ncbi:hypothetical protein [Marinifilum fragile]|uniref:hypothetical protein n=1 Tax=Marinifilum fragile TaxID=570161 RepID=UPI0006D2C817|nr:hypothetical protein [Marinifilum fragile]